jgi:regulatory protein
MPTQPPERSAEKVNAMPDRDDFAAQPASSASASLLPSKKSPSLKGRALRLLATRDYGRVELERKLGSYADSPQALQAVLDDLQIKGFISDERAAASLLNRRANKLGVARVLSELRQKGFAADLIASQADILRESEESRIKSVWLSKFSAPPSSPSEKAKQMRFLASRGFSSSLISRLMRQLGNPEKFEESSL